MSLKSTITILHPRFLTGWLNTRRRFSWRFLIGLTATFFLAQALLGDESSAILPDDPFAGFVTGQIERTARRSVVAEAQQVLQAVAKPVAQEESQATSAPSLFRLNLCTTPSETVGQRVRDKATVCTPSSKWDMNPVRNVLPGTSASAHLPESSSATHQKSIESTSAGTPTTEVDIPPQMKLLAQRDVDVVIDGHVDEEAWKRVAGFENLIVVEPDTLVDPEYRTQVRIFYSDSGLFVSAEMDQPSDTLVQRLSARDQDLNRDGFAITVDTSGKGSFGFWFAINLGGSKEDGKVLPERNFSREWDGAWQGATVVTANGWSAELFIPWSIVAMPPGGGERRMNFFVSRKVAFRNERYGWPALPFTKARFMSAMQPIAMHDVNPKQQWEVFPYATTSADAIHDEMTGKVGMNFSWRPAPNMQVTGSLNPDFGAVESDDVVVNLTAFETFFPEKRLFFLEGSEVFETSPRSTPMRGSSRGSGARTAPSTYVSEPTTVLNTRRIGGAAKDIDIPEGIDIAGPERSKPTDLIGAVKLVGQSSAFRFGVLGAIEDDVELRGTNEETDKDSVLTAPGRNFSVARLLWERQSGRGRQAHGYINTFADTPHHEAMVHGVDSHFLTQNGKWSIDTQLLNSQQESESGYGGYADIRFTPKQGYTHRISLDYLDDKLDISDLGFIRRNDLRGIRYTRFANKSSGLPDFLRSRSVGLFVAAQENSSGELIRAYLGMGITFYFNRQSMLNFQYSWRPSLVDDLGSDGNGSYETEPSNFIVLTYGTDTAKAFSFSVQGGVQDDELGDPAYIADVGFTYSPITRLRFDYDFRYRDSHGWVISTGDGDFNRFFSEQVTQLLSLDFFVSARQQLRATMQWTGINATERDLWHVPDELGPLVVRSADADADVSDFTISRLTAQLRYRWEIAPLSDLFVVYTRGSNVPSLGYAEFNKLFREALRDPIVDVFVVKLRYRFGS